MKSTTIFKFSFFVLAILNLHTSFSQKINEPNLTFENTNQKITAIQTKIESVSYRINQLKSQIFINAEQYNYIINLENTKVDLSKELSSLERIKTSILYAEENNLIQNKKSSQPKDHIYKISQKTIIKQIDFDSLPENKKLEILAHPDQYEISK